MVPVTRVAQSAGIGGLYPSIAKDLIDSEDPKHTLFCREIAFAFYHFLFLWIKFAQSSAFHILCGKKVLPAG